MSSNCGLYCLKWKNHYSNLTKSLFESVSEQCFVDVTLACEDGSFEAHKLVLSTCSIYFKELLKTNPCKHPIIIFKDIKMSVLRAIVDFMYKGEVNICHNELGSLLKTAETFKVKGLTETSDAFHKDSVDSSSEDSKEVENHYLNDENATPIQSSCRSKQKRRRKQRKRPVKQHELNSSSETDEDIDIIASIIKPVNSEFNEEMPGTSEGSNLLIQREDAGKMSQSSYLQISSPNIVQTRRRNKQSQNDIGQTSNQKNSEQQLSLLRRDTNEANLISDNQVMSWHQDSQSMDNEDQFDLNIEKSLDVYEQEAEIVTFNDEDLVEYMSNANTRQSSCEVFACYLCHVTFTAYSSLRRHMKRHCADPVRFECEICKKNYSRKDYLKKHKAKKHGIQ